MSFPRLKNALLCRMLIYVIVLGGSLVPIIIVANLRFLPEFIKLIIYIASEIGLLIYLIKNLAVLMAMDVELAMLHCHNTARKRFVLPGSFSVKRRKKEYHGLAKSVKQQQYFLTPEYFNIRAMFR